MIEKICPLIEALLVIVDVPPGVACGVAKIIPKLVGLGRDIASRGGDIDAELDAALDVVEMGAIARFQNEPGFK